MMREEWLFISGVVLGGSLIVTGLAIELKTRLSQAMQDAQTQRDVHTDRLLSTSFGDAANSLERKLAQVGFSHPSAVAVFTLLKLAVGVVGLGIAWLMQMTIPMLSEASISMRVAIAALLFAIGFLLPVRLLERGVLAYRARIERAVPDALDLMQICVDAGQSLDQSFLRVARELAPMHPELASHFAWSSEAIAAGLEREEALLKVAEETGNEDLRLLAMTVVQAAKLGTPISRTLRVFGDDLRDRRLRKVEQKTNVLPTKMTLGTMFFTIPPLLILLVTPAIVRITEML